MTESGPRADYSAIARSFDAARRLPAGAIEQWAALVRDRGRLTPGSLCLDLGCGTGRFTIPIAEVARARVTGADISAEMLAEAASKPGAGAVWWVRCDARDLAFGSGAFQCVFMSLLLHHVDDMRRVLRECCGILRPGGVCLIRTSGHDDIHTMPVYRFFPRAWEIDRNRLPEIGVIEQGMLRAGFGRASHEKVTQELVSSTEEYLDKMRRRNISSLTFLSDQELAEGLSRMKEHFESIGEEAALAEVATEQMTLVIGEK
ncbi:MAG TPA: methyltransferase domain-containing protein [Armatimonadota bacterium]|nr:methyltransferase domain-containing protein [Armatimonadota bacterium]